MRGHEVRIGYFDQKLSDLDEEHSLIDEIRTVRGDFNEDVARNFLGRFRFTGDDGFKKVKGLSGGERNRLTLAKMMLRPRNLLALDEPTNHLDIPGARSARRGARRIRRHHHRRVARPLLPRSRRHQDRAHRTTGAPRSTSATTREWKARETKKPVVDAAPPKKRPSRSPIRKWTASSSARRKRRRSAKSPRSRSGCRSWKEDCQRRERDRGDQREAGRGSRRRLDTSCTRSSPTRRRSSSA